MQKQKSQPKEKRTMSVPEMRQMLGLGKTESYWLVKKGYFRTTTVYGRIRIYIDSFEEWYANQYHYRKTDGTPPGEKLGDTLSAIDVAKMLGVCSSTVYDLVKRDAFTTMESNGILRIHRRSFEKWYERQFRYKKVDGTPPGQAIGDHYNMTAREMSEMLGIPLRNTGYELIAKNLFESRLIDGQLRIDRDSFELWYCRQDRYHKIPDSDEEV